MSRARWIWDSAALEWVPAAQKKPVVRAVSNVVRLPGPAKSGPKRGRYVWYRNEWVRVGEPSETIIRKAKGMQVVSDIAAYRSPICDENGVHPLIDGRREQREDLKRHGCRIKEPSETLARAGIPKPPEPVITRAMERTAVEAYERAMARQDR